MNFSTYRFTLDLHKHQSQMSVAVFQYDTAVRLNIGITDGGVPYLFEDGVIARLVGEKANGTPIVHNCSIEENSRIIYTFNKATSDIVGIVNCQIRFYKVTGDVEEEVFKLTAPKFIIVVGARVGENVDSDVGDGEFSEQFSALDEILAKETARVTAEEGRVEAEQVRDGNERLRIEKEQMREEFEAQRQTAEAQRQKFFESIAGEDFDEIVDFREKLEDVDERLTIVETLTVVQIDEVDTLIGEGV